MRARPAAGLGPVCAVTLSAATWGVFWMPLRAMHGSGVSPGWATSLFFLVPVAALAPIAVARAAHLRRGGLALLLTGLASGGAMALYSGALILTDVVRALLLFYLTPVWSTVLERIMLRTPVGLSRMLSMLLGVAGLLVILGIDVGPPVPRNAGDWMGLASGLAWAVAAVRIRADETAGALDQTIVFFAGGALAGVALALLFLGEAGDLPTHGDLARLPPWTVAFVLLVMLPSMFFIMWGAARLDPGVVGILFMSEISVGAASAALWAGEPFGLRELSGVVLVSAAGVVEVLAARRRRG